MAAGRKKRYDLGYYRHIIAPLIKKPPILGGFLLAEQVGQAQLSGGMVTAHELEKGKISKGVGGHLLTADDADLRRCSGPDLRASAVLPIRTLNVAWQKLSGHAMSTRLINLGRSKSVPNVCWFEPGKQWFVNDSPRRDQLVIGAAHKLSAG